MLPGLSLAQGCISVFSENGEKFYLLLNGEKQNPGPQKNVRVDGLLSESYYAKIIFENESRHGISQLVVNALSNSGKYQETTYEIVKSNDGSLKLKNVGVKPIPESYTPTGGVYSTHYGQASRDNTDQPDPAPVPQNAGGNGRASISIIPQGNSSETTTTASFSAPPEPSEPLPPAPCNYPMDVNTFKIAKTTVSQASFEDTKLSTAEALLGANCITSDQVAEICKLFGFEDSKLKFAKYAYPKTTDRENYTKVINSMSFEASKNELKKFIASGGK